MLTTAAATWPLAAAPFLYWLACLLHLRLPHVHGAPTLSRTIFTARDFWNVKIVLKFHENLFIFKVKRRGYEKPRIPKWA